MPRVPSDDCNDHHEIDTKCTELKPVSNLLPLWNSSRLQKYIACNMSNWGATCAMQTQKALMRIYVSRVLCSFSQNWRGLIGPEAWRQSSVSPFVDCLSPEHGRLELLCWLWKVARRSLLSGWNSQMSLCYPQKMQSSRQENCGVVF